MLKPRAKRGKLTFRQKTAPDQCIFDFLLLTFYFLSYLCTPFKI
jgi:hypothetical protein